MKVEAPSSLSPSSAQGQAKHIGNTSMGLVSPSYTRRAHPTSVHVHISALPQTRGCPLIRGWGDNIPHLPF